MHTMNEYNWSEKIPQLLRYHIFTTFLTNHIVLIKTQKKQDYVVPIGWKKLLNNIQNLFSDPANISVITYT